MSNWFDLPAKNDRLKNIGVYKKVLINFIYAYYYKI
ncbi:hypothetical protein HRbin34_00413 [bacterium HR34]|nr:hypothetical protein HRbin34_00413 [bacterium HR34]